MVRRGPGQRAHRGHVVVIDVGPLVRGQARRYPPQPEQAHHVVHAQRAAAAGGRVHQIGQGPVVLFGQPLRVPGLGAPVLAQLVELVRRRAHGNPGHVQLPLGPDIGPGRAGPDGQVLDDADAHAGFERRGLGRGQLPAGQPLQPGVEVRLPAHPAELGRHHVRAGAGQYRGPFPPVRAACLGQHAPGGPVTQLVPGLLAVPVVVRLPRGAQRYLVQDLERGPLGRPHRVPVDQLPGLAGGPERLGQRGEVAALALVQRRVLRDVLDPQVQRADELPAHRQVWRRADRRDRLGGVQRVDQHEPGPELARAQGGQVSQVAKIAVPPGRGRPDRVELDGQAPGPLGRRRRDSVRPGRLLGPGGGAAGGRVPERGEDGFDRGRRHGDLAATRGPVRRGHSAVVGGTHQFRRIHGPHRSRPGGWAGQAGPMNVS